MNLSISTGTFYAVPFWKMLELIKKAGFEYIELLLYWKGSTWEMGQHLRDTPPAEALRMIEDSGLKISSIHDGGGLLEEGVTSIVSKSVYEYMVHGAGTIPCIVFHPPVKLSNDLNWWEAYQTIAARDLTYFKEKAIVCLENLFPIGGESIPLLDPAEMLNFITANDICATIDTTHCAQSGIHILQAAKKLGDRVRTVHLSDYAHPKSHVFVGEGTLDLKQFMRALDQNKLHALTLECDVEYHEHDEPRTIERLKQAYNYMKEITEEAL